VAFILPALATIIAVTIIVFAWMIFRPEPPKPRLLDPGAKPPPLRRRKL
jgi:hypothetical protein